MRNFSAAGVIQRIAFILLLTCSALIATAQTTAQPTSRLTISGYVDAYYASFSDSLPPNEFEAFTTVAPRNERIGLNVAQLTVAYADSNVRAVVGLHAGDIPQATWSPDFQLVQEANVGIRLAKALWLDAGFFTTHIGTESFLPKNNMLSSTAVATYNEPFYQSGARLSYEPEGKLQAQLWVLNGYNRFLDNNNAKSIGLLLSYAFSENTKLTYTNLLGNEAEEDTSPRLFRTYHNLYLNQSWRDKIYLTVGGDVGTQTNSDIATGAGSAYMYNLLLTTRYQFTPRYSVTARVERFWDKHGIITGLIPIPERPVEGLQLFGITAGAEYAPAPGAYLRLEARLLETAHPIFFRSGKYTDWRSEVLLTLGLDFDKVFVW